MKSLKERLQREYDGKEYTFGLGHYGSKFFDIEEK